MSVVKREKSSYFTFCSRTGFLRKKRDNSCSWILISLLSTVSCGIQPTYICLEKKLPRNWLNNNHRLRRSQYFRFRKHVTYDPRNQWLPRQHNFTSKNIQHIAETDLSNDQVPITNRVIIMKISNHFSLKLICIFITENNRKAHFWRFRFLFCLKSRLYLMKEICKLIFTCVKLQKLYFIVIWVSSKLVFDIILKI